MSKVWDFLKYIWKCVSGAISCLCGHPPENYGWKETLVGGLSIFIIGTLLIFLWYFIDYLTSKAK